MYRRRLLALSSGRTDVARHRLGGLARRTREGPGCGDSDGEDGWGMSSSQMATTSRLAGDVDILVFSCKNSMFSCGHFINQNVFCQNSFVNNQ